MALLGAALWFIGTASYHVVIWSMTGDPGWRGPQTMDAVGGVSIIASLMLFWYTRRSKRDPLFIFDLGLGYLVLGALGVGIVWHLDQTLIEWKIQPMITWAGAMVLIFAAVIPSTPVKTLVASLITVSMNPVGMLIARAPGVWRFESLGDVVLMHYPDYMLVGVAVVISYVVTRLGQQVARARELGSYQLGDLIGRGGMGDAEDRDLPVVDGQHGRGLDPVGARSLRIPLHRAP